MSAGTRFLDPINLAAGIARGEDFKVVDTKQGMSTIRQAFRYMDQFMDMSSGGQLEEKMSPTQGQLQSQATKAFSTSREVDMTDLERVFNLVGVRGFKAGLRTDQAALKNRYADLFYRLNESTATALLKSSSWRKADQKTRKMLFDEYVQENRKRVAEMMRLGLAAGDKEKSLLLDIENKTSAKELKDILEELDIEDDIGELGLDELYLIDNYVDTREDLMKFRLQNK